MGYIIVEAIPHVIAPAENPGMRHTILMDWFGQHLAPETEEVIDYLGYLPCNGILCRYGRNLSGLQQSFWEFHDGKLSSRSEVARKFGKSG